MVWERAYKASCTLANTNRILDGQNEIFLHVSPIQSSQIGQVSIRENDHRSQYEVIEHGSGIGVPSDRTLIGIGLDIEIMGIAMRIPNNHKTAQKCKMKTRHDQRGFTNGTFWYIGATEKRGGSNFENEIAIEGCKLHE